MSTAPRPPPRARDVHLLLDEDTPVQLLPLLRHLLPGHTVDHAGEAGWAGEGDRSVLAAAAGRGYDLLLARDDGRGDDPGMREAVRRSGLHYVRFEQRGGLDNLARAIAAVTAAIVPMVRELERAPGPRMARISAVSPYGRYLIEP